MHPYPLAKYCESCECYTYDHDYDECAICGAKREEN